MAEWMWNTGIPEPWIYGRSGAEMSEGWTSEKEAELNELQLEKLRRDEAARQSAIQTWQAVKPALPRLAMGVLLIWLAWKHPNVLAGVLLIAIVIIALIVRFAAGIG
jgi:hypothetical protein